MLYVDVDAVIISELRLGRVSFTLSKSYLVHYINRVPQKMRCKISIILFILCCELNFSSHKPEAWQPRCQPLVRNFTATLHNLQSVQSGGITNCQLETFQVPRNSDSMMDSGIYNLQLIEWGAVTDNPIYKYLQYLNTERVSTYFRGSNCWIAASATSQKNSKNFPFCSFTLQHFSQITTRYFIY